jgi:hypothetical protein
MLDLADSIGLADEPFKRLQADQVSTGQAMGELITAAAQFEPAFAPLAARVDELGFATEAMTADFMATLVALGKLPATAAATATPLANAGNAVDGMGEKIETAAVSVGVLSDEMKAKLIAMASFSRSEADQIADSIVNGLADGIKGGTGKVTGAISALVNEAIEKAREEAGIRSPSKRMAEIGRYMREGLVEGWGSGDGLLGGVDMPEVGGGGFSAGHMGGDTINVYLDRPDRANMYNAITAARARQAQKQRAGMA